MKTAVEIPEELAQRLEQHAARNGRAPGEDLAALVRLALLLEDLPIEDCNRIVALVRRIRQPINQPIFADSKAPGNILVRTDAETGLPAIDSPPDAPIRSMTSEQIIELIEQTQFQEDMSRAGLAL